MRRPPAIVRSLMLAALALLVLVQSFAFAASLPLQHVDATPAAAQPCDHGGAVDHAPVRVAMPCCDDEGGCTQADCGVDCYRSGVQFAGLPTLESLNDHLTLQDAPVFPASAFASRLLIPPLPPPISA